MRIAAFVRSQLYMATIMSMVLIFSIPCTVAIVLPYRYRYAVARAFTRVALWLLRHMCGIVYRVEGLDNLPRSPSVVYCKHESVFETIAVTQFLPNLTWVLKRELMWIPFLGWGLFSLRAIAINRRARASAVQQVIEQGKARLGDGLWVMIYPEGTRVMPGTTRRYGLSGALLAREARVSVVPIAVNSGDCWPRHGLVKKPGTITLRVGPPIDTEGRSPQEINARARDWIETELAALRGWPKDRLHVEV